MADSGQPSDDRLVIDANGNLFGTTADGGGQRGRRTLSNWLRMFACS